MIRKSSLSNSSNCSEGVSADGDTVSVATSESLSDHNEVVLADNFQNEKPTFGSIQVKNSTDIHFGNKTYYQGPVTIKQILYANSDGAIEGENTVSDSVPDINNLNRDNLSFVPDNDDRKIRPDTTKISVEPQRTTINRGTKWIRNFSRQHVFLFASLGAVLVVSLITLMSVLLTRHQPFNNKFPNYPQDSNEQDNGTPVEYPAGENATIPDELYIITRNQWLAQPPKNEPTLLNLPVPYVIIMHTASDFCQNTKACKYAVTKIRNFHVDSTGWDDIGYSFLVGGDGYAYEGRGWYVVGAQVYGYNTKCIGIAFIGTFIAVMPPKRQIIAAQRLIERGVNMSVIAPDYKLLAAKQLQTTQSPGDVLYEEMKTWDHWSPSP